MLLKFRIPLVGFLLSFKLGTTLAAIENLAFYGVWLGSGNDASILRVRTIQSLALCLSHPLHLIFSRPILCQHILLPHLTPLLQSIQNKTSKD